MNYLPCRNRTFCLELGSVYDYVSCEYSHWMRHLTERLGRELALGIWGEALSRFDVGFLDEILSQGWNEAPNSCALVGAESPVEGILKVYFADHEGDGDGNEDKSIISKTHPLPQIRQKLSNGSLHRETTTYEAIHLYCHGFALIAESLIDHFGNKGELLVYDIRLEEIAAANFEELSVEEFFRRRRARFSSEPKELDMHTAGLEAELVSANDTEVLTHTKECEWVRYYRDRHPRVGYLMCCSTDAAAYRAINARLRLQRTATLMEGDSHCDFRVYAVD